MATNVIRLLKNTQLKTYLYFSETGILRCLTFQGNMYAPLWVRISYIIKSRIVYDILILFLIDMSFLFSDNSISLIFVQWFQLFKD